MIGIILLLLPLRLRKGQESHDASTRLARCSLPGLRRSQHLVGCPSPQGRKPVTIAFDFSPDTLLLVLTKWPHMASMAFLYLLALIATGLQRSVLAAALVFGVGVGWELAQSTVIGHNARIADLLPNAAALTACVLVTWIGQMLYRRTASARALSPPPARAS